MAGIANIDYNRIQQSAQMLEQSAPSQPDTEFEQILNAMDDLKEISQRHDDYLEKILKPYEDVYTTISSNNFAYIDLIDATEEIAKTWKKIEEEDGDRLTGLKSIDKLLGLKGENKLSKIYQGLDSPTITTNAQDVEGFITSAIDVSDYKPDGYENREAWKQALIQNYLNQGYSQESAESLAALEMANALVATTGAYSSKKAESINNVIAGEVNEVKTKNAWYASQVTPVETDGQNQDVTPQNTNSNNSSTAKTISYRVASTAPASTAAAASQTVQEVVNNTPPSVEEITPPENSTPDTTPPSTEEPSGGQTEPGNGTDNNIDNTTDNTNNSNNSNNNTQTPPPASNNNTNNTPSTPQQPQNTPPSNANVNTSRPSSSGATNSSGNFNSTSPQAGPDNTLTSDSGTVDSSTTTDLPTGNTGPGSELDVISIDKEPSTSSTSSSNGGGSVIPAVIGVGAAAAAGVAGVKYIKDKKQKDNTYEDEDEDENSFSYLGDYNNDSEDTETTYSNTKYKAGNVNNLVLDEAPSDLHIEEGMPEMSNEELE